MKTSMFKIISGVLLISVLGKILGFTREMFTAYLFGASFELDAYLIAYAVPGILFGSFGSAIQMIFMPMLIDIRNKRNIFEAKIFFRKIFYSLIIILTVFTILLELGIPYITKIFAPGFTGETYNLTVNLMGIMMPIIILLGMLNLFTSIMHSENKFYIPALQAVILNTVIIVVTFIFYKDFGIYSLTYATLIGIFVQVAFQYFGIKKEGYDLKPLIKFDTEVKDILIKSIPILISSLLIQFNSMVDRLIASGLKEGSISSLSYANRVMLLPMTFVVTTVMTVYYPKLVDEISKGNRLNFVKNIEKQTDLIALIVIPLQIILIVFSNNIVKVLFERGAFDSTATEMTSHALIMYSFGLGALAFRELLNRVFWSNHDSNTTVKINTLAIIINIILSLTLYKKLEHGGIALATSVANICAIIIGLKYLNKKYPYIRHDMSLRNLKKIIVVNFGMLLVAIIIQLLFSSINIPINPFILFSSIIMFFIVYWILLVIFKEKQILQLNYKLKHVTKRFLYKSK